MAKLISGNEGSSSRQLPAGVCCCCYCVVVVVGCGSSHPNHLVLMATPGPRFLGSFRSWPTNGRRRVCSALLAQWYGSECCSLRDGGALGESAYLSSPASLSQWTFSSTRTERKETKSTFDLEKIDPMHHRYGSRSSFTGKRVSC